MMEIEVKIKIDSVSDIEEKIKTLGGALDKARRHEVNTLYDFTDGRLFSRREALRLRRVDRKYYFTFKGPHQKSRKFKIREEFETEVKNGRQFEKILQALGLKRSFHYEKHRTVYRWKRLKICLDETDAGTYLELEGQQSDIVRFAGALGFPKDTFITLDYIQLLTKAGAKKEPADTA